MENLLFFNNGLFELEIRESQIPNAGLGVYTKEFIKKGELIGEYTGSKIDSNGAYSYILDNGKCIDASSFPRCYSAMINDSIGSIHFQNCEFVEKNNKVFVYAKTNIPENYELFISYGIDFWRFHFTGDYENAYFNTLKKLELHPTDTTLKNEKDLFSNYFLYANFKD